MDARRSRGRSAPITLRLTMLLAVLCVCSSCTASWPDRHRRAEPAPLAATDATETLTVFSNGFHSGFYIREELIPFEMSLDPRLQGKTEGTLDDAPKRSAYVEVGFSNKEWALAEDRSWTKVARLLLAPDDGLVLVTNLDAELYRSVRETGRVWRIPVTAGQMSSLLTELSLWLDPAGASMIGQLAGERAEFYASTYDYAMCSNCHDWTAYMLTCIGMPMPDRWWRTAETLHEDLDEVLRLSRSPAVNAGALRQD